MDERKGLSPEIKNRILLLVVLWSFVLGSIFFYHPWINQDTVDDYMKEKYPGLKAILTDWAPFGHNFVVKFNTGSPVPDGTYWMTIGYGYVDLFGRITYHGYGDGDRDV